MHPLCSLRSAALSLAPAALLAATALAQAQGTTRLIRGTVTDSGGRPVPYVNVQAGRVTRVITNDSGGFRIPLRDRKPIVLEIRRLGFVPADIRLEAGGDTTLAVALIPTAQPLPGAVIAAMERDRKLERQGFYRRMADRENGVNSGHFITGEDIERRLFPPRFTSLLDGIPSVRVSMSFDGLKVPLGSQDGGCILTTYLDGIRLPLYPQQKLSQATGFYSSGRGGSTKAPLPTRKDSDSIDDMIKTSAVAGVEVYTRGTQAPPEYSSLNGNCGVILIWTR